MYREELPIERRVLGEEHFLTLSTRAALAENLMGQGDYAGAEKSLREVVALNRKTLGEAHPTTIDHTDDLGIALAHEHRNKEAEQVLSEALRLAEKSKANNSILECMVRLRDWRSG